MKAMNQVDNVYDLIHTSNGITPMNFGLLEKTFDQSLCSSDTIKCVKVRTKDERVIILRYSYNTNTEHLNHIAENYEKWISQNYKRFD